MNPTPIDLLALPPLPVCLKDRALWTESAAWHRHHARVADAIRVMDPACPEHDIAPRAETAMNLQFAYADGEPPEQGREGAAAWDLSLPIGPVVTFDVVDVPVPYVLAVEARNVLARAADGSTVTVRSPSHGVEIVISLAREEDRATMRGWTP